jgi:phosphodiesterase/alkaline phosphatase D-like protein
MQDWTRRDFLKASALTAGALATANLSSRAVAEDDWDAGPLRHVIPLSNHDTFLLKTSFTSPRSDAPVLRVDTRRIPGEMTDTQGRFWRFHTTGLEPDTAYTLRMEDAGGHTLTDPWPLKTLPHPDSQPEHFRLAVYTCAGGSEGVPFPGGHDAWIPIAQRARLLDRLLSYNPDVIIGVGDQVYWDQITGIFKYIKLPMPKLKAALEAQLDRFGRFDRAELILGTQNETVLSRVVDEQLTDLYGVRMRSVPTILTQDDHDYFENDEASDDFVSFPPDSFMMRAARATQRMYFPELLPDRSRPAGLGDLGGVPQRDGLSEAYGTLRYGKLFEGLLYDCRRFVTMHGPSAVMIDRNAEDWLLQRMQAQEARYVVNVPSTPFGWTAGKWGEWYPDFLQPDGTLGTASPKPYWQHGWLSQHDRILRAASDMKQLPLFVSGDLHAVGTGVIPRTGERDLSDNPVVSVLSGPISSGAPIFASTFRGIGATPSVTVDVRQEFEPLEKNGFTIFDFTPDNVQLQQFAWRGELGDPVSAIPDLQPFHQAEYPQAGWGR